LEQPLPRYSESIPGGFQNWEKNNDAYYVDNSKKTSDDNIMGFFKELGVKIYDPSKAETEPFRKLTIPVFNKYRNQIGPLWWTKRPSSLGTKQNRRKLKKGASSLWSYPFNGEKGNVRGGSLSPDSSSMPLFQILEPLSIEFGVLDNPFRGRMVCLSHLTKKK